MELVFPLLFFANFQCDQTWNTLSLGTSSVVLVLNDAHLGEDLLFHIGRTFFDLST